MGFVWHNRTTDAGIDGSIEVRNPATGAVANRHLFVQSKASNSRFPGETADSFHYICDQRDIDYWLAAEVPVLLICSHPDAEQAWWADVSRVFTDPVRRASGRVDFTKSTDHFDRNAAARLLTLADPRADAHTVTADSRPEQLQTNLLPVALPPLIFSVRTSITTPGAVYQALRAAGVSARADWTLHDGHVHTFADPAETGLATLDDRPPEVIDTAEWVDGAGHERNLVRLLNRTVIEHVAADCSYHRGRNLVFFRASPDLSPIAIKGASGRTRRVFYPKVSKKTGNISYYKHAALAWRFLRVDDDWLCALSPDYHYTRDGYQDSRFISDLLSGIKRLDKNLAVLGATRMWATYLRGTYSTLEDTTDPILDFAPLHTVATSVGIDDATWSADLRRQSPPTKHRRRSDSLGCRMTATALTVLDEPELEFHHGARHIDPRHGVTNYGPADTLDGTARTIRVGVIGTAANIDGLRRWLDRCRQPIAAKDSRLTRFYMPFPGFDTTTGYRSTLVFNSRLERTIRDRDLAGLTSLKPADAVPAVLDLYLAELAVLDEEPGCDVVLIARPDHLPEGLTAETDPSRPWVRARRAAGLNFRAALKGASMDSVAHCSSSAAPPGTPRSVPTTKTPVPPKMKRPVPGICTPPSTTSPVEFPGVCRATLPRSRAASSVSASTTVPTAPPCKPASRRCSTSAATE
jgi:hypothetical protein